MSEPVDKSGGPKEVIEPKDFFARLKPVDLPGVLKVIDVIKQFSADYHNYNEYDSHVGAPGFFGVYGIGGTVTKTGERPDIDLLLVTNIDLLYVHDFWPTGYRRLHQWDDDYKDLDMVAILLKDGLAPLCYRMDVLDPIPDQYAFEDDPDSPTRALLRLIPILDGDQNKSDPNRKPIDIVYDQPNLDPKKNVHNLFDFEEQDTDKDGNSLPKVLLYSKDDLGRNLSADDED
jgi:hypothetical protein